MVEHRSPINRRRFLRGAAGTAAAVSALGGVPSGLLGEAVAAEPRRGSLDEVEHVVILMQENRSFDHYYGTLRGVRGFGDRVPVRLADGRNVFHQPDPLRTDGGALLPFHVDTSKVDGQDLGDLDHSWNGTHAAYDGGAYDAWVAAKTELTMGYFTRADLPFHHALADAFTICDNYFCSVQGPTTPNRLFLWTGTNDPNGQAGGPAISNPDDYQPVYSWTTYPERLEQAGVSWQVYANNEVGDDSAHPWVGDYGDNPLWLFPAYHDALASSDPAKQRLAQRANVTTGWLPDSGQGRDAGHVLAQFITACRTGTLPAVSWVVAPYLWSEHPLARPVDGALYVQTMLQALWSQPDLWRKTVVFLDFDENDGFFDHVVPPVPPVGTPDEFVGGRPVGLGPRVPMTVVSPFSSGGWVNSQVFDHTSVIRFLEAWTGVREPNISAWRRAVCGDLTSAFDFRSTVTRIPLLPDAAKLRAQADATESKLPKATPPAIGAQTAPAQEPGTRPARPLPYQPTAAAALATDRTSLALTLANAGTCAVNLQVFRYDGLATGATNLDVAAGGTAATTLPVAAAGYHLAVHGPNGFLAEFAGTPNHAVAEVTPSIVGNALRLTITAVGGATATVTVSGNAYARFDRPTSVTVRPGHPATVGVAAVADASGWYDVTVTAAGDPAFTRRFVGHIETGAPSITG